MKKRLAVSCFFLLLLSSLFADFDALLQIYAPFSAFNINSGKNGILFEAPSPRTPTDTLSLSIETRFKITSIGKVNLSGGVMFTPFWDSLNSNKQIFAFSTGIGANYNFFWWDRALSGITVFVYPLYYFPLFVNNDTISYRFKSAFDIGYNLIVAQYFSIYAFERNVLCWDSNHFQFLPDFGFAVGFNFPINGQFPKYE